MFLGVIDRYGEDKNGIRVRCLRFESWWIRFIKINSSRLLFHVCALRRLHVRGKCSTISEMLTFSHQVKLLGTLDWCRIANKKNYWSKMRILNELS
jgi:hypothetical protein